MKRKIMALLAAAMMISSFGCNSTETADSGAQTVPENITSDDLSKEQTHGLSGSEKEASADMTSSETPAESSEEETTERYIMNPVKVSIASGNDSKALVYESISDIELNRPDMLRPDEVFLGWAESETIDKIGDKTVDVSDVIAITAESSDISESPNVIFNDAVYVDNDIPTTVVIPISVGGQTKFSVLEMDIGYDGELLEFDSFENVDPDVVCNCRADENRIYFSVSSVKPITADITLCNIVFRTRGISPAETLLEYNIKEAAVWDTETSDFYDVKHSVIGGKIVLY